MESTTPWPLPSSTHPRRASSTSSMTLQVRAPGKRVPECEQCGAGFVQGGRPVPWVLMGRGTGQSAQPREGTVGSSNTLRLLLSCGGGRRGGCWTWWHLRARPEGCGLRSLWARTWFCLCMFASCHFRVAWEHV